MSKWPLRYHFLRQDELELELVTHCVRLLHSRPTNERGSAGPSTGDGQTRSGVERSASRRCYVTRYDRAGVEFPRLLDPDERIMALIGTLNETASLLHDLA